MAEHKELTPEELDRLRVRLSDPKPNGDISFDLGLPRWQVPMS